MTDELLRADERSNLDHFHRALQDRLLEVEQAQHRAEEARAALAAFSAHAWEALVARSVTLNQRGTTYVVVKATDSSLWLAHNLTGAPTCLRRCRRPVRWEGRMDSNCTLRVQRREGDRARDAWLAAQKGEANTFPGGEER